MTSPTWLARGSWKKLLAPACHSELLAWLIGGVCGMRATISWLAGLPTGDSFGGVPMASMRSIAPQPDKTAPISARVANLEMLFMGKPICGRW